MGIKAADNLTTPSYEELVGSLTKLEAEARGARARTGRRKKAFRDLQGAYERKDRLLIIARDQLREALIVEVSPTVGWMAGTIAAFVLGVVIGAVI